MLLLIPLFPFAGFLLNASLGRRIGKRAAGAIACGSMLASFVVSAVVVWRLVGLPPEARAIVQPVFAWITSGELDVSFTLRLDPLSALMILVVTGIGALIHIYSTAYMHDEPDPEYARYFSYLNLFAAFMLVLVLGSNFLVMFVGWEGVGLCSYLLIGFWYQKKSASDAGKKAFIVNRIGDFGFLLGVLLLFVRFGTLDFQEIARALAPLSPETTFGTVSLITLLLFVGATGKSAQIPLYVWLPDAMEGPTPVSALIHAATMVTAGVYMIGRNAVLFSHAPETLTIIAVIGAATALMAGTIGMVQNDIKRVLAYSTVSQLGYMFLAMGVGAYSAGIFHLFTHAFFKALLFLGSGAVIHALAGEQDLRRMGGLKAELPITYWTFVIGAVAIAGVPGLAGFFSKDEILYRTFAGGHTVLWVIGVITSLLTAIYMFRLVHLAFHGPRTQHAAPSTQHAGTQHPAHRRQHSARGTEHPALRRRHESWSSPRRAAGNGDGADRPRRRLDFRRLRRGAARPWRLEPDRAVSGAELHRRRRGRSAGCGEPRGIGRRQPRAQSDGGVHRRRLGRDRHRDVLLPVEPPGGRPADAAVLRPPSPALEQVPTSTSSTTRRWSSRSGSPRRKGCGRWSTPASSTDRSTASARSCPAAASCCGGCRADRSASTPHR